MGNFRQFFEGAGSMRLYHGTKAEPFGHFEAKPGKRFVLWSATEVRSPGFFFTYGEAEAPTS